MAVIADAEHWTFRGGPEATIFGKPWVRCAQGQVQHDRKFYLYAICPDLPLDDYRETIRLCRHYAHQFGWVEIIFERIKSGVPHEVHIPIKPGPRSSRELIDSVMADAEKMAGYFDTH